MKAQNFTWLSLLFLLGLLESHRAAAGNAVTGTCADLANHIASPGVVDSDGTAHPQKAAWTTAHFSFITVPTTRKHSSNFKADIPPPADCLNTYIHATFTAQTSVAALTWSPDAGCDRCKCEQKAGSWNNSAKDQKSYIELANQLAADANARWESHLVSYCGRISGSQGRALLAGNVYAAAAAEANALEKAFADQREGLDDLGLGDPPPINCGTDCGSCAVGTSPQMCMAPGQKCDLGQCKDQVCCFVARYAMGSTPAKNTYGWMSLEACVLLGKDPGGFTNIASNDHCANQTP